jgi:hypothetical protein
MARLSAVWYFLIAQLRRRTWRTAQSAQPKRGRCLSPHSSQGFRWPRASELAGIGRRTAYDWRAADDEFRKAWDEAVEYGTDLIEDEALRRARDGVERPFFLSFC